MRQTENRAQLILLHERSVTETIDKRKTIWREATIEMMDKIAIV